MTMENNKKQCFICNQDRIPYLCVGCSKNFCIKDFVNHRIILNQELHHIIDDYKQFKERFNEERPNPHDISLINQIEQWKIDSIEKITQKAKECTEIVTKSSQTSYDNMVKKYDDLNEQIKQSQNEDEFNEINLNYFRNELKKMTEELNNPPDASIQQDSQPFISGISIVSLEKRLKFNEWKENAITVAGGNREGPALNQLKYPMGIFIDKNKNIFIADNFNDRIVEWKYDAKEGQIIAGTNKQGNRLNQLNFPTDVIVDQQNHSIIIADQRNRRVIQWLDQKQQVLIHNVDCFGLAMDKHGFLYVSDYKKNEVRRWKMGEYIEGVVVAGRNGNGNQLNQLNYPTFIFVDEDQSVYVSDTNNHRVMKWRQGATEGRIVAGGNGKGINLNQLSSPYGVIVDDLGQIYVAATGNDRITRWCEGKEAGEIVVGGNGQGSQSNQLTFPMGLSFDHEGNLYVGDYHNNRIQKFEIIL